jgi:hypothetical protein
MLVDDVSTARGRGEESRDARSYDRSDKRSGCLGILRQYQVDDRLKRLRPIYRQRIARFLYRQFLGRRQVMLVLTPIVLDGRVFQFVLRSDLWHRQRFRPTSDRRGFRAAGCTFCDDEMPGCGLYLSCCRRS